MYYLWVNYLLFGVKYMTTQKFLIPDGIEYYTGEEARLFENLKSEVLHIFDKYVASSAAVSPPPTTTTS